jgi:hypothetical protein
MWTRDQTPTVSYLPEFLEIEILLLPSVKWCKFRLIIRSHPRCTLDTDCQVVRLVDILMVHHPGEKI